MTPPGCLKDQKDQSKLRQRCISSKPQQAWRHSDSTLRTGKSRQSLRSCPKSQFWALQLPVTPPVFLSPSGSSPCPLKAAHPLLTDPQKNGNRLVIHNDSESCPTLPTGPRAQLFKYARPLLSLCPLHGTESDCDHNPIDSSLLL